MFDAVPDAGDEGPVDRLRNAWRRHVDTDTHLLDRLVARHGEKHRRYHTVHHVDAVVGRVVELADAEAVDDLGAVIAAALYHDAVYEPESRANERASARLAGRDLRSLGWASDRADAVSAMIEGTREHRSPSGTDEAVLFDGDLSVLAATPNDYRVYVDAVRSEYRHVSDDDWVIGRSAVLASFLDRQFIYATETGRQRWEATARANITTEVSSLTG